MSKTNILAEAGQAVDHLLDQYREYLAVQERVRVTKDLMTQTALAMARQTGQPFPRLLQDLPGDLGGLNEALQQLERELQAISDAMTFANPVVWVQYKFAAYAGTSQAIADMDDFRKHCSKPDYICTKRFEFLNDWLKQAFNTDLRDEAAFAGDTVLSDVYPDQRLLDAVADPAFMKQWDTYEYFRTDDGRVAKWENFTRY